jgi:hypothetical protein
VELAPHPIDIDLGAFLDADDEGHLQLRKQGEQGHIGKATVGRHPDPSASNHADHPAQDPPNPRQLIALHAPFQHRRVIRPPVDGYGSPTDNERDNQQVLIGFSRPVDGQPHGTLGGQLDEGLQQHGIGQVPWLKPLIVQQPRQAFGRGFLIAKVAGQLRLTARLLVNDRGNKVTQPFALMTVCPRQHIRDILVKASSRRVLSFHSPRLSQGHMPWLLVTYKKCPDMSLLSRVDLLLKWRRV